MNTKIHFLQLGTESVTPAAGGDRVWTSFCWRGWGVTCLCSRGGCGQLVSRQRRDGVALWGRNGTVLSNRTFWYARTTSPCVRSVTCGSQAPGAWLMPLKSDFYCLCVCLVALFLRQTHVAQANLIPLASTGMTSVRHRT